MDDLERSRDLYEAVGGYPAPPQVPLPAPDDPDALQAYGLSPHPAAHALLRGAMALSGFSAFLHQAPATIENLLRTVNLRGPALFAPAVAATLALAEDARALTPFERAATLVCAAWSLRDAVFTGALAPDTYGGQPLEMGQYPNLFGTSLICDDAQARLFKTARTDQLTVVVGGRFFVLPVTDWRSPEAVRQLAQDLADLAERARSAPADPGASAGPLSAASDATQRRLFPLLRGQPDNAAALDTLRHSLLTLCLDLETTPATAAEAAYHAHSGSPANRWFHASLQLVVFGNARACAIAHFSAYLDGNTMMRGAAEIQRRAAAGPLAGPTGPRPANGRAHELRWQIDSAWQEQVEHDLASLRAPAPATFVLEGFGRSYFERQRVDAVPAFVVALQRTANRLAGQPAAITQFLAMSRYRCMDLVTGMMSTPEVQRCAAALDDPNVDAPLWGALLQAAHDSQAREARRARQAIPYDDLLALFMLSRRRGWPRQRALAVAAVTFGLLRAFGWLRVPGRQVLISHPEVYPEIPVVGRPGARLPYVRDFGLHYQILADQITLTVMPSLTWRVPNAELAADLHGSLAAMATRLAAR